MRLILCWLRLHSHCPGGWTEHNLSPGIRAPRHPCGCSCHRTGPHR